LQALLDKIILFVFKAMKISIVAMQGLLDSIVVRVIVILNIIATCGKRLLFIKEVMI